MNMSLLVATNLVFLAQDDTGSWNPFVFFISILAFPCLVICHIIRVKLRNAKDSEKQIEELQKKVSELEKQPREHC